MTRRKSGTRMVFERRASRSDAVFTARRRVRCTHPTHWGELRKRPAPALECQRRQRQMVNTKRAWGRRAPHAKTINDALDESLFKSRNHRVKRQVTAAWSLGKRAFGNMDAESKAKGFGAWPSANSKALMRSTLASDGSSDGALMRM